MHEKRALLLFIDLCAGIDFSSDDIYFLGIDANAIFYPERSDVDTMLNQFQRMLAGCTGDELEMLLSINREILIHTRRMDEVGEVETV